MIINELEAMTPEELDMEFKSLAERLKEAVAKRNELKRAWDAASAEADRLRHRRSYAERLIREKIIGKLGVIDVHRARRAKGFNQPDEVTIEQFTHELKVAQYIHILFDHYSDDWGHEYPNFRMWYGDVFHDSEIGTVDSYSDRKEFWFRPLLNELIHFFNTVDGNETLVIPRDMTGKDIAAELTLMLDKESKK